MSRGWVHLYLHLLPNPYNKNVEFSEWITKKYVEWRGVRVGRGSSIADFANEFGAPHQVVSKWMHPGSKPPKAPKYLNALEKRYGAEFLQVLGIEKSETVSIDLSQIPPELRARLQEAVAEIVTSYASRGISPDSPEAVQLASKILAAHGFTVTSTKNDNSG
jgi:hypothetical protein